MEFLLNALLEFIYAMWPYILKLTVHTTIHVVAVAQTVSVDSVSNRTVRRPYAFVHQLYKSGLTSATFH